MEVYTTNWRCTPTPQLQSKRKCISQQIEVLPDTSYFHSTDDSLGQSVIEVGMQRLIVKRAREREP